MSHPIRSMSRLRVSITDWSLSRSMIFAAHCERSYLRSTSRPTSRSAASTTSVRESKPPTIATTTSTSDEGRWNAVWACWAGSNPKTTVTWSACVGSLEIPQGRSRSPRPQPIVCETRSADRSRPTPDRPGQNQAASTGPRYSLEVGCIADRIPCMAKSMTADDILPLVASLTPQERIRLLRLITSRPGVDSAAAYATVPPGEDEFSSDEEPLAWEAEGWEEVD